MNRALLMSILFIPLIVFSTVCSGNLENGGKNSVAKTNLPGKNGWIATASVNNTSEDPERALDNDLSTRLSIADFQVDKLATIGSTVVTTWKDNKACAYSISFDDSLYPSILKFEQSFNTYDLYGSLCLITKYVDDGTNPWHENNGSWDLYKKMLDRGRFDVVSHTDTHPDLTKLTAAQIDTELAASYDKIYKQTGDKPLMMAAPYGANNRTVMKEAAKYYLADRAILVDFSNGGNAYNTTDYYNLKGSCALNNTTVNELNSFLDKAIVEKSWSILVGHGCDGEGYSPPTLATWNSHFKYVQSKAGLIWNGKLNDVIRYLKERQFAAICFGWVTPAQLQVSLTHSLDNSIYNYPLTLRTQVPASWSSATVVQGLSSKTVSVVTENATNYIYYEAIPNQSLITISGN